MPNFKISPLDFSDIEAVIAINARAHLNDELTRAIFPLSKIGPEYPQEEFSFRVDRLRKRWNSGGGHFFKCTDEDAGGRLVAATIWFEPGGKQWRSDPLQGGVEEETLPSYVEPSRYREVMDAIKDARERILKGDHNVWYLASLTTDPDYQCKGIGRMMMQWGIEQADRNELSIYLEGTPAGKHLYDKLGFETVEELTFPGVMMRKGGPFKLAIMLRKPGKKAD